MKTVEQLLTRVDGRRVVVVFPHPDDEVFMAGGLIQRLASRGCKVEVISLTQGGRGRNCKNEWRGEKLKRVRRVEFELAMIELGVECYRIWNFADGELKEKSGWKIKLGKELERIRPDLVVSYGPSGVTGHPDHIAVGRWLFGFLKRNGGVLLWPVWPGWWRRFMVHRERRGSSERAGYRLDLDRGEMVRKCRAMKSYGSQLKNWSGWRWWLMEKWLCRKEFFARADFRRRYKYKYVRFEL